MTVQTGHNLNIIGGNVADTQEVNLAAGNQLTITTSDEARYETHFKQEKKSGLMGTGGVGFTMGSSKLKQSSDSNATPQKGSTVAAVTAMSHCAPGNRLPCMAAILSPAKILILKLKKSLSRPRKTAIPN
ncbi:hemagglutinin repeat-containing protein [Photorhabdus sp. RW14-46]|uniref:hemagglutinin repeat-containing protein n=1 Tax=Photorhabdus sp. RW14-46 TaxID=2100168 RepID=UPI0013F412A6